MPHLHLPADHTDADLVLAANLAEIVGSEDLYVAWSHETGPGAIPEVEAVLREERRGARSASSSARVGAGVAAFWRALLGRPARAAVREDAGADPGAAPAPSVRTLTELRLGGEARGAVRVDLTPVGIGDVKSTQTAPCRLRVAIRPKLRHRPRIGADLAASLPSRS